MKLYSIFSQPNIRTDRKTGMRSRAFTLVEITIALVVFVIGILSVMYMFPIGLRSVVRAKIYTQANFLAQLKMEEVLAQPGYYDVETPRGNFEDEYADFEFTASKDKYKDTISLYQVKVEVYHPINGKKEALITLYALKGVVGQHYEEVE